MEHTDESVTMFMNIPYFSGDAEQKMQREKNVSSEEVHALLCDQYGKSYIAPVSDYKSEPVATDIHIECNGHTYHTYLYHTPENFIDFTTKEDSNGIAAARVTVPSDTVFTDDETGEKIYAETLSDRMASKDDMFGVESILYGGDDLEGIDPEDLMPDESENKPVGLFDRIKNAFTPEEPKRPKPKQVTIKQVPYVDITTWGVPSDELREKYGSTLGYNTMMDSPPYYDFPKAGLDVMCNGQIYSIDVRANAESSIYSLKEVGFTKAEPDAPSVPVFDITLNADWMFESKNGDQLDAEQVAEIRDRDLARQQQITDINEKIARNSSDKNIQEESPAE